MNGLSGWRNIVEILQKPLLESFFIRFQFLHDRNGHVGIGVVFKTPVHQGKYDGKQIKRLLCRSVHRMCTIRIALMLDEHPRFDERLQPRAQNIRRYALAGSEEFTVVPLVMNEHVAKDDQTPWITQYVERIHNGTYG